VYQHTEVTVIISSFHNLQPPTCLETSKERRRRMMTTKTNRSVLQNLPRGLLLGFGALGVGRAGDGGAVSDPLLQRRLGDRRPAVLQENQRSSLAQSPAHCGAECVCVCVCVCVIFNPDLWGDPVNNIRDVHSSRLLVLSFFT